MPFEHLHSLINDQPRQQNAQGTSNTWALNGLKLLFRNHVTLRKQCLSSPDSSLENEYDGIDFIEVIIK